MLQVESLTKVYSPGENGGGIRNIGFDVTAGEFYTLLGPSGCGKTTTLRAVAGLEVPTAGRMTLEGRTIFDSGKGVFMPANQRRLGMVFQSYAVWPHMTVFENTAFPLRMLRGKRWSELDIRQRVMRTLETMGLASFASRSAAQLSGGQQQRLSLARALVAEPRLLLLDEPLSNLDALLREQMRSELRRLQKEVGITTVYVTHDQSEALALSDRIAVMHDGRIA
ncbi:MAG: ABC transporter ATP-binding protein, partial [Xanthobacteraceae bacterium]